MARSISSERKAAFYLGTALMVVGALLFASVFVTFIATFGDFTNLDADTRSSMVRAFGGMALLVAGKLLRAVGARGLAGSGVVLDPSKARRELEPFSRMAGGMVQDALEETSLAAPSAGPLVRVRCRACGRLSDEDAKFCSGCGQEL